MSSLTQHISTDQKFQIHVALRQEQMSAISSNIKTTLFGYEQPKHPKLCIADLLYGVADSFSKKRISYTML